MVRRYRAKGCQAAWFIGLPLALNLEIFTERLSEPLAHLEQGLSARLVDTLGLKPTSDDVAGCIDVAEGKVDFRQVGVGSAIVWSKLDKANKVNFGFAEIPGA